MKLAPRREKFASEYVKNGFNGAKAIAASGYRMNANASCVEASRLLRNPNVKRKIAQHLQAAKMDADEVISELSTVARTKLKKIPSENAKLKALELIGKAHSLFTEKIETTQNIHISAEISSNICQTIILVATRENLPELEIAEQLQRKFSLPGDSYDPNLDVNLHPEIWGKFGNLLNP